MCLHSTPSPYCVEGDDILVEVTRSSPIKNYAIENTVTNSSHIQPKPKCKEMLSHPNDQKTDEFNMEQERMVDKEKDISVSEYKQGLFVIYVDETYVDL